MPRCVARRSEREKASGERVSFLSATPGGVTARDCLWRLSTCECRSRPVDGFPSSSLSSGGVARTFAAVRRPQLDPAPSLRIRSRFGVIILLLPAFRNLSCVTVVCPHLLRYYAVYAILNRKRKDHFQAVITAIGQGKNRYSDPFTSLLEALFLDFNFDEAQHHIARIGEECDSDFFLQPLKGAINEFARLLIFETYCRIHKCINVDMIAKKVNMSPEAAERWIVNLIRHARLEARIDSEKNRVQMSAAPPNLYQQVIDKTRNLCIRSNLILQNIARPAGFTGREGDDVVTSRTNRQRGGRGRQWVQGGEGDGFYRGEGGRGGRGGRGDRGHMGDGRRDPMAAVAASMASRRQDDTAFAA
ncbi:PCI domain-containing protein [Toxoplasma gondii RUB]|uniref:PCI domain-containing protein n=1 Tax=Toxoplasma gondii RUB TaxID=935652 RepID=A0A086M559_TOXGO|nr:PCI domain-containing protein [Toxoplasma gondii RUB]